jgi:hypothetical protein
MGRRSDFGISLDCPVLVRLHLRHWTVEKNIDPDPNPDTIPNPACHPIHFPTRLDNDSQSDRDGNHYHHTREYPDTIYDDLSDIHSNSNGYIYFNHDLCPAATGYNHTAPVLTNQYTNKETASLTHANPGASVINYAALCSITPFNQIIENVGTNASKL